MKNSVHSVNRKNYSTNLLSYIFIILNYRAMSESFHILSILAVPRIPASYSD